MIEPLLFCKYYGNVNFKIPRLN